MDQINYIRDLISEKLSLKPDLELIEKLGILDNQINFLQS
jgi:hypothetical protein